MHLSFVGNSIKPGNINLPCLDASVIRMFYQKKGKTGQLNTPNYVISSPNDVASTLNFTNYLPVGNPVNNYLTTFQKIGKFSKIYSNNISDGIVDNKFLIEKINNLHTPENYDKQDTYQYESTMQHNFSLLNSFLPCFTSLVDNKSFKTFVDYSTSSQFNKTTNGVHNSFFTKAFITFSKELELLTHFNQNLLNYIGMKSDSNDIKLFKKFCNQVKHSVDAPLTNADIARSLILAKERAMLHDTASIIASVTVRAIARVREHDLCLDMLSDMTLNNELSMLRGRLNNIARIEERAMLHDMSCNITLTRELSVLRGIASVAALAKERDILRNTAGNTRLAEELVVLRDIARVEERAILLDIACNVRLAEERAMLLDIARSMARSTALIGEDAMLCDMARTIALAKERVTERGMSHGMLHEMLYEMSDIITSAKESAMRRRILYSALNGAYYGLLCNIVYYVVYERKR